MLLENRLECLICHKEFKQITTTHLKKEHSLTINEYKEMFPECVIMSVETRQFLSDKCKNQNKDNDFGFKDNHKTNCDKIPWNKEQTKQNNDIIRTVAEKMSGRTFTEEHKYNISKGRKIFLENHPDHNKGEANGMYGKKLNPEHLKALWSKCYNTINKVESEAYKTLIQYGFKYVGDRKFWLTFKDKTHKCPDFINRKFKYAVEIFGDYWHKNDSPEDLIKKYNEIGWTCFVYWERDIYNNFCPEILEQDLNIFEFEDFNYEDFDGKWML